MMYLLLYSFLCTVCVIVVTSHKIFFSCITRHVWLSCHVFKDSFLKSSWCEFLYVFNEIKLT